MLAAQTTAYRVRAYELIITYITYAARELKTARCGRTNDEPPLRLAPRSTQHRTLGARRTRAYNFASSQYNAAFGDLPPVDRDKPKDAPHIWSADAQKWYDDPVATCIAGKPVEGGESGPRTTILAGERYCVTGDIDGILTTRDFDG